MNKKTNRHTLRVQIAQAAAAAEPASDHAVVDVPAQPQHDGVAANEDAAPAAPKDTKRMKAAAKADEKFTKCTFSLPRSEARMLDELKQERQIDGVKVKKGQLLRAGLLALADIDAAQLAELVARLPKAPSARKKKEKSA